MSVQAMTWALTQQVVTEPSARHVLLCLSNYAGPDGRGAFPSVATLCEDTGYSRRTVQDRLRDLDNMGVISKGNQGLVREHVRRADQRPVCYDINMSRGAPAAPRVEHTKNQQRGATDAPRESERGAIDDVTGRNLRHDGAQSTTSRGAAAAPDPSINHHRTVNEPKRARKRSPGFDPMCLELPDWLDTDLWGRWVRHRVELRKPLTEEAAKQQLRDLASYRLQGHTPTDVIEHAIGKSWQGLFAPKGAGLAGGASQQGKFNPTQYVNRNRNHGGNDHDDSRTIDV